MGGAIKWGTCSFTEPAAAVKDCGVGYLIYESGDKKCQLFRECPPKSGGECKYLCFENGNEKGCGG